MMNMSKSKGENLFFFCLWRSAGFTDPWFYCDTLGRFLPLAASPRASACWHVSLHHVSAVRCAVGKLSTAFLGGVSESCGLCCLDEQWWWMRLLEVCLRSPLLLALALPAWCLVDLVGQEGFLSSPFQSVAGVVLDHAF